MKATGDPRALLRTAAMLQQAGRLAEAESAYTQALQQQPDVPDAWYNLGLVQRLLGRFDAALASYQQALARGVAQPEEVHLNCGVIYSDHLRRDDAAERELLRALELNPTYAPALLNLANLREDYGRREEALSLYERILASDRQNAEALARYAALKGASGAGDPLIARLRARIDDERTHVADKASLGFALGKTLDACAAYDEAFEAYRQANCHSRQSADPRFTPYDRGAQERLVDEVIRVFAAPASPPAIAPPGPARPIFICGMFRSGSTLTEQVLAAHPRVASGGELPFIPAMAGRELAPFPRGAAAASDVQFAALRDRYLQQLERLFPGAAYVTDKRPDNFLYVGLIKRLFPHARIVNTRRNPLDNCLSVFFLHLDQRMSYALDLMDIAHYYAQCRRLMSHWQALYGPDILEFDYDEFVHGPRAGVERLLEFCGLPWDESCLHFHRARNAVKTASVSQVREPLYQRSSGRWRCYEKQLAPVKIYLKTLLERSQG